MILWSAWAAIVLVYLWIRIRAITGVEIRWFPDSQAFLHMAGLSPWSRAFLFGPRPPTVPLFYAWLGGDPVVIVSFQQAFSVVAWGALGLVVASVVSVRGIKPLALAAILAFSCSGPITQWENTILSESISLSLLSCVVATGILLLSRGSWVWSALFLGFATLWGLARESNAYGLLMLATALLSVAAVRRAAGRKVAFAVGLSCVFLVAHLSSEGGKRWSYPLLNVLAQRVLTDPDRTQFFEGRGMPVSPALLRMAGEEALAYDWAFFRDPDLQSFRDWYDAHGRAVLAAYLLRHPGFSLVSPLADISLLLGAPVEGYRPPGFRPPLGESFDSIVFPRSPGGLILLTFLAVGSAAVTFRKVRRLLWTVPGILLLLAPPTCLLVWHADSTEIARHALPVAVQIRLGLWLLAVLAADGILGRSAMPRRSTFAQQAAHRCTDALRERSESSRRDRVLSAEVDGKEREGRRSLRSEMAVWGRSISREALRSGRKKPPISDCEIRAVRSTSAMIEMPAEVCRDGGPSPKVQWRLARSPVVVRVALGELPPHRFGSCSNAGTGVPELRLAVEACSRRTPRLQGELPPESRGPAGDT